MRAVVLCCAGTGNFGDDIVFAGMARRLLREGFDLVEPIFRITPQTLKQVNSADRLVIGGGELLAGTDILTQVLDRGVAVPYEFRSIGVGTVQDVFPRAKSLRAERWTARTDQGVEILRRCGLSVELELDPIFEFAGPPPGAIGRVALCLRNEGKPDGFVQQLVRAVDEVVASSGCDVDLVSCNAVERAVREYAGEFVWWSDCNDLALAETLADQLRVRPQVLSYTGGPEAFLGMLGQYRGVVSERLHAAMAAYVQGVPFRLVVLHDKMTKFARQVRREEWLIGATPEELSSALKALAVSPGLVERTMVEAKEA